MPIFYAKSGDVVSDSAEEIRKALRVSKRLLI